MKLEGTHTFPAAPEVLWQLLMDAETLARVIPGCEVLEPAGPHLFRGTAQLRVGQIEDRYEGTLQILNPIHGRSTDLLFDGEGPGGLIHGRGAIVLEVLAPDTTSLNYDVMVDVGGRIAETSPRLLETTGRAFVRRCLESLEKQVDVRTRVYTTTVHPASSAELRDSPAVSPADGSRLRLLLLLLLAGLAFVLLLRRTGRRNGARPAEEAAELLQAVAVASETLIEAGAGSPAAS